MEFKDKTLKCKDCGQNFIWSAGEQQFFAQKGFDRQPIRCSQCRKKKKERIGQTNSPGVSEAMHQIKCKKCAKVSEIPFQPSHPDNILCSQCFAESIKSGV